MSGAEPAAAAGTLAANVLHFARLLRRAGLPVGPAEAIAGAEALALIDPADRAQFRDALRAVMVHRHEQREIFDQAFALFWRSADAARAGAALGLTTGQKRPEPAPPRAGARRVAEALGQRPDRPPAEREKPPLLDAALTASEREQLRRMDFETMGAAEIAYAKREVRRLALPLDHRPTRRFRPDPRGARADLRATLRQSLRRGGEILEIAARRRQTRPPPLVVLCDISGSMVRYARILLFFLHALANARARVQVFLFGTRLSNVTRQLRHRDAEVAFQMLSAIVPDWSGGTRIGETIGEFNRVWGRRVLAQGAVVLLMTDGLDRDGGRGLAAAMERLHRSSRRLLWLNPLLRWDGFAPKSQGIRAMLPHVDEFRPVHNLASLATLVDALSRTEARERAGSGWAGVRRAG